MDRLSDSGVYMRSKGAGSWVSMGSSSWDHTNAGQGLCPGWGNHTGLLVHISKSPRHGNPVVLGEWWRHVYREIWVHLLLILSMQERSQQGSEYEDVVAMWPVGFLLIPETHHPHGRWGTAWWAGGLTAPRNPLPCDGNLRAGPRAFSIGEPTRAKNNLCEGKAKQVSSLKNSYLFPLLSPKIRWPSTPHDFMILCSAALQGCLQSHAFSEWVWVGEQPLGGKKGDSSSHEICGVPRLQGLYSTSKTLQEKVIGHSPGC